MELSNRAREEEKLAGALRRLTKRHRQELVRLLGNPPRAENVPPGFWARVEREVEDELWAALAVIMLISSRQHGFSGSRIGQISQDWARGRSTGIARGYAQNSRNLFGVALRDLTGKEKVSPGEIDDRLNTVFGPARSNMIARTETTAATSQGSELAADRIKPVEVRKTAKKKSKRGKVSLPAESIREGGVVEVSDEVGEEELRRFNDAMDKIPTGKSTGDTWFTSEMDNVCPVCSPLHGVDRRKWSSKFPEGPPAHPNCNCWIDYERDRLIEDLKSRFDIK